MGGFLTRALRYFDRASDTRPGAVRGTATFAQEKLEAIRSYADFCRTGKSPGYPLEIFLEISNICDLKCAMCVQFSGLNVHRLNQIKGTPRGFMDQGEISENIEQALQHALLVHCFGYGEPTIHPTFRSFLDLVSRHEVMIDFFTNGMHLDEEFCQFLVDRRVYQITVSFSGATKETYESIYLGGDFERVLGGLKRLAEIKKAQGIRYPIIEINSLAFRDHVGQFDKFVTLMADHGVDVVMLKPLQSHRTIPELYEHVSIMRPAHEGEIVSRAMRIGRQRGVEVNATLYMQDGVKDESEYERRLASLTAEAEQAFGKSERRFGETPVSRFSALAADIEPIRDPGKERRNPRVLGLDAPRALARSLLQVRAPSPSGESTPSFYCMEPFKTLYVSRNGAAKTCCFANPEAWYLGDAKQDNALSVWRGSGFQATRAAIAEGEYPMRSCEVCIRRKSGPQGHFTQYMLNNYLDWHRQAFEPDLRGMLEAKAPGSLRAIAATPSDIMVAVRKDNAATIAPASTDEAWPVKPVAARTTEFVASRDAWLHRDFGVEIVKKPQSALRPPPGVSREFLLLLQGCGRDHYTGEGSIVDLGLPAQLVEGLLAGLTANPRMDAVVAAFERKREKVVERFALAAGGNDLADSSRFIKNQVGDVSSMRWLASKPIEICLVQGGANAMPFQRALRRLLPHLIPGRSIVIQSDFYLHREFYPKVLMGYLAGSFEWLGQAGLGAVFRFVEPVASDLAGLDPYTDLPAELAQRFHHQWAHAGLSQAVRLRLDLSYAQLLSRKLGREAALAHLDALDDRYRDLLSPEVDKKRGYAKALEHARQRWAGAQAAPAT